MAGLLANFPHLVDKEQVIYNRDAQKGIDPEYKLLEADLACFVQAIVSVEIEQLARQNMQVTHKVLFPQPPGANDDVRFVWTNAPDGERHLLEYVSDHDASAGLGILYRVNCNEVSQRIDEDA